MQDYHIIRSRRRTVSLEVTKDADIIVRVPRRMSDDEVAHIVDARREWLKNHVQRQQSRHRELEQVAPLSLREIESLRAAARVDFAARTRHHARELGLAYGRVTIRLQKTRWGSCSNRGNLNFNCLLMLAPETVRDYVVIHELCHLMEMNHSPRFWAKVEMACPDYRSAREWLKNYGDALMARAFPV
mgnify:CR=1 FL=1